MIKRIQFFSRRAEISPAEFQTRWLHAFTQALRVDAPARAVANIVLHDVPGCEAAHDAISMEWFDSTDPYVAMPWEATSARHDRTDLQPFEELGDAEAYRCIIADELVLRGADWLDRRWLEAAPKFKHMALARRAHGLSAAEFSERWRNRAGQLGGGSSAPVITIPDAARGHAYVQNHPCQLVDPSAYDAINEVYFDHLTAMRARIEFFAQHDLLKADSELISLTHFAVVREHMISVRS